MESGAFERVVIIDNKLILSKPRKSNQSYLLYSRDENYGLKTGIKMEKNIISLEMDKITSIQRSTAVFLSIPLMLLSAFPFVLGFAGLVRPHVIVFFFACAWILLASLIISGMISAGRIPGPLPQKHLTINTVDGFYEVDCDKDVWNAVSTLPNFNPKKIVDFII